MMRVTRLSLGIAATAVVVAIAAPNAYAGEETGVSLYVPDKSESTEMADGSTSEKTTASGFAVSSDPASPMYLLSQTCSANWLVAPDGTSRTGKGTCDSIDPEGDTFTLWWRGNQEAGTWGIESGTGKWAGATGGGTWQAAAAWEDGRYANSWTASWIAGPDTTVEPPMQDSPLDTGGD